MAEVEFEELFGPQARATKRGRLQSDDSPNAVRIRDNQRRSRARHKEYVDDLQRKVLEYEQRGTAASLDMQRAARDVALENSRLRSLLTRNGVSNDEVDTYLASFSNSASRDSSLTPMTPVFEPPTAQHSKVGTQQNVSIIRSPESDQPSRGISNVMHTAMEWSAGSRKREEDSYYRLLPASPTTQPPAHSPNATSASPIDKLSVLANASVGRDCCAGATHCVDTKQHEQQQGLSQEGRGAPAESGPPAASPLEMSCNAAARIIADMQGHGDKEMVRNSLGCCSPDTECYVKNTTVFQILDNR